MTFEELIAFVYLALVPVRAQFLDVLVCDLLTVLCNHSIEVIWKLKLVSLTLTSMLLIPRHIVPLAPKLLKYILTVC